jgi:hypothetical protein
MAYRTLKSTILTFFISKILSYLYQGRNMNLEQKSKRGGSLDQLKFDFRILQPR